MNTSIINNETLIRKIIWVLAVAIPVVVALLLAVPQTGKLGDVDVSWVPGVNALLNSATALCLIAAFVMIKKGDILNHRRLMLTAFSLSSVFLVLYVLYHFQAPSTRFGDVDKNGILDAAELASVGVMRYIYLFILLTHILLAVVIVPMVLFSIYFGLTNQVIKHKRLSKYTFPTWLYVAVSGVMVYIMISPYY
jgi:putative membrane protein